MSKRAKKGNNKNNNNTEITEELQTKYIKCVPELDFNIPPYIALEETKVDNLRIEASRRGEVRFEEKSGTRYIMKIVLECWKEMNSGNKEKMLK